MYGAGRSDIGAHSHPESDAFNHFAQNANFNRGDYRVLETGWANDIKQGKTVWVKIVPSYTGSSQRPSTINILYTVDGALSKRSFSNAPKGKNHDK